MNSFILQLIATGILLVAVVDDLRSRKIHNKLILILIPIALLSAFTVFFIDGGLVIAFQNLLTFSLASAALSLFFGIALWKAKILGGGDVKIYFVFSLVAGMQATLWSLLISFIWGGVLGIIMSILKGNWKNLFHNLFLLARLQKLPQEKLQHLPFSVVLFLGWISFQVLKDVRVF